MIQKKQFRFELKEVGEEGVVSGYASVFGVVDSDNEVIDKGAFKRTISHKGGKVPVLWQHDRTQPVGWGMEASEDDRGLPVKFQLLLACEQGRYAHAFVKTGLDVGAKVGLSIGFRVPANGSYVEKGVRHFREVELVEYSVVTFPANQEAAVTGVKGKSMDFNAAMQTEQSERDLNEERWMMQSTLYDVMEALLEDATMTAEEKKVAATTNIEQYAAAMTDWWARRIDLEAETASKAGKTISAETARVIRTAIEHINAADTSSKMSGQARKKARSALQQILNPEASVTDVNKPSPVGGGKSEDEEVLAIIKGISFQQSRRG